MSDEQVSLFVAFALGSATMGNFVMALEGSALGMVGLIMVIALFIALMVTH